MTAELLGYYEHGYQTDFDSVYIQLYRKRTGEFFIAGRGGARSRYAHKTCEGDGQVGGKGIDPLTVEEAKEWCLKYLDTEEYLAIFGTPNE